MNVHNQMEEIEIKITNRLFDQVKELDPPWFSCDCENCRMDAISYVLNRVPPKYVVSGRGVTYNSQVLSENQVQADLEALSLEAIRIVNTVKRPYHNATALKKQTAITAPIFNFPLITGTVLDGTTFEPLYGATVELKQDGKLVTMMDASWNNPAKTYQTTKGTYTFWLKPYNADKEGENKSFNFTIEISAPDYESTTYALCVPVVSAIGGIKELNSTYSLKVQDLFLFRNGIENPME